MDKTQMLDYALQYVVVPLIAVVGWLGKKLIDFDKRMTAVETKQESQLTYEGMMSAINQVTNRLERKLDSIENHLRKIQ